MAALVDVLIALISLAGFVYAGRMTFHHVLFVNYYSSRTSHLGVDVLFTIMFAASCSMFELLIFEVGAALDSAASLVAAKVPVLSRVTHLYADSRLHGPFVEIPQLAH